MTVAGADALGAMMIWHIFLMEAVAPALALWWRRVLPAVSGRLLVAATVGQLVLLWGWHAPAAMRWAMADPAFSLLMQVSLAAAALLFWAAVLATPRKRRWQAVFSLLVTGKLFCLLGALFVFARTDVYGQAAPAGLPAVLADQQLAGLVMLSICPLTYVLAGIVLSARWYLELDRQQETDGRDRFFARPTAQ